MISDKQKRLQRTGFIVLSALLLGGCQGMAGSNSGYDANRALPGQVAKERYAHVSAAINTLDTALGGSTIKLDVVPMAPALYVNLPQSELKPSESALSALRRLAVDNIIDASSYRLVHADTLNGRLEYRSTKTGAHLSVTVRAPSTQERRGQEAFVVSDMFAQSSLASLVRSLPSKDTLWSVAGNSSPSDSPLVKVRNNTVNSDAEKLGYFNSIPAVERNREDILSIRAMLMMRLGQDKKAAKLVEQGIVRYPHSPIYFTMANVLFERKSGVRGVPDSLSLIMNQRFNRKQLQSSRRAVDGFLQP